MKRKYDVIFPLGEDCHCSLSLRRAKLQFLSFPCDWAGLEVQETNRTEPSLLSHSEAICNDFKGYLDKGDFELYKPGEGGHPSAYRNTRTQWVFYHDFAANATLDSIYPSVREKYDRRINRFYGLAEKARAILFVHLDRTTQRDATPIEELRKSHEMLAGKFSGRRVDSLLIRLDRNHSPDDAVLSELAPGMFLLAFDYSHTIPGKPPYEPNFDAMTRVLRRFFSVRDYRPGFWSRVRALLTRSQT